jgi:hypothetical protein
VKCFIMTRDIIKAKLRSRNTALNTPIHIGKIPSRTTNKLKDWRGHDNFNSSGRFQVLLRALYRTQTGRMTYD